MGWIERQIPVKIRVEIPTKTRVEKWALNFNELMKDPKGRQSFQLFLKKEFSGENLGFWEACEDLKYGDQSKAKEKAEEIYKTFLAPGARRWINIDSTTMGITVRGLKNPQRYVLDAAQTHIYMLMKKRALTFHKILDSYNPFVRKHLRSSPSPILLRQLEEEAKAREAATNVDITQLCQFTVPVSHLAVYTSTSDSQCPGQLPLPNTASYSSPLRVALGDASVMEKNLEPNRFGSDPIPSLLERAQNSIGSKLDNCHSSTNAINSKSKVTPKPKTALSLGRFLKWRCLNSPVFATLSPKHPAAAQGKVQPLEDLSHHLQPKSKKAPIAFFQISLESKIHPMDVGVEEDHQESAKEVICPWEVLTEGGQSR
ncbi:Regulator of G-protein signaling 9, partial [Ophiophagus hannah]